MALLTPRNLLRWHDAAAGPAPLPVWGAAGTPCSPLVVWAPGEVMRFYVPLSFTPGTLAVYQADGSTSAGTATATFTTFAVASGTHAVASATCPALPDGIYKLGIGAWRSQEIEICGDAAELAALTVAVEASHPAALGPLLYPYVFEQIADWTQRFRLRLRHAGFEDAAEFGSYQLSRTGEIRPTGGVEQKIHTFAADEVTEDDLDALALLLKHQTLTLGGVAYTFQPEGNLKRVFDPVARPGRSGHGGEFSLYVKESAFVVR